MIVITGPKGTVLHTGDFRYNYAKMLSEININPGEIDYMYIDNTFATYSESF